MSCHQFTVPCRPVGKQRPRVYNGRAVTPKKTLDYEKTVALYARGAGVRPVEGPVRLSVDLHYDDNRWRDIDNAIKSIQDALEGIAYENDRQIYQLEGRKFTGMDEAKAVIKIEILEEDND